MGRGNVISTEGKTRALHFSPGPDFFTPLGVTPCVCSQTLLPLGPGFDLANFHVIVQTWAWPRACFRLLLIFMF